MAKILRKPEVKRKKVITTTKTISESIQNYKLLPKHMIPKKQKYMNSPG